MEARGLGALVEASTPPWLPHGSRDRARKGPQQEAPKMSPRGGRRSPRGSRNESQIIQNRGPEPMTENALQKVSKSRPSELPKQGFRIGGVAKIMISKGREKYTKKLPKVVPKSKENRFSFGSRRVPQNGDAKTIDKASTHTPKGSQIEPKMGSQIGELLPPGPLGCPQMHSRRPWAGSVGAPVPNFLDFGRILGLCRHDL